jgi:Serine dehydrogenase proteinase
MPAIPTPAAIQAIGRLDTSCRALAAFRKKPMLVMFYPPRASITDLDITDAYSELRAGGVTKEHPLPALDLFLDTYGGDPMSGYRIAQVVRSMTASMDVLIPEHAYSAGTLMSFAGNVIRMGDFAGLSPIDITVLKSAEADGVQLAGLDSFSDFARGAREKTEQLLQRLDRNNATSTVDSDLLVQMVKEIGALTVGRYYRERTLTGHYAEILLQRYMFKGDSDGKSQAGSVIAHFLFGAPSHEFHLDHALCKDWHLKVERMSTEESDISMAVLAELRACTDNGIICHRLNPRVRMPFIRYYSYNRRRRTHVGTAQQKRSRRTRNP